VFKTLKQILSQIRYATIALVVAVSIFLIVIWGSNIKLIVSVFSSQAVIFEKIYFLFNLLGSIVTNFTITSAIITIVISLLFGINICLLIYLVHFSQAGNFNKINSALSFGGLFSGLFGIGCATCGTFVLSSLLGLFDLTGVLLFLPFKGEEIGFLGIVLLIFSIYFSLKKITELKICKL